MRASPRESSEAPAAIRCYRHIDKFISTFRAFQSVLAEDVVGINASSWGDCESTDGLITKKMLSKSLHLSRISHEYSTFPGNNLEYHLSSVHVLIVQTSVLKSSGHSLNMTRIKRAAPSATQYSYWLRPTINHHD